MSSGIRIRHRSGRTKKKE